MAANSSSPSAGGGEMPSPALPPVRLAAAHAAAIQPSSPRYFFSSLAGTNASSQRRIAIAVDLSDESAYAVRWAVQNYLRPGDAVVLLHVRPTSVLYGADWGSIPVSVSDDDGEEAAAAEGAEAASAEELQKKREEDFDTFTSTKSEDLAQPLVAAQIPFKIHVVKDHDMKERLCLEAERLGLSAMIMGSRGFGASRKGGKGRLGSVSDYCVHHCVCPVVVVRYPDDAAGVAGEAAGATDELHTVPEDEPVYHDAPDAQKEN
jgi:nucleotide-binding universal stress UspA family protein